MKYFREIGLVGVLLVVVLVVTGFSSDSFTGVQSAGPEGVQDKDLSFSMLSVTGCSGDGFDTCLETSNSFGDATANPELRIDELSYLAVRDDKFIVEPGYTLDYSCSGVKAWISEDTGSPDLSWSEEGVSSSMDEISLEGGIGFSKSLSSLQVTCADHSVTDSAWSGTSVYNYWNFGVREAVDSDGDGIYNFEDDCETVAGPESNSGCPVNEDPVINGFSVPERVGPGERFSVNVDASDPDGDELSYTWFNGDSGSETSLVYGSEGVEVVSVNVSDGRGGVVSVSREVVVSSSELGFWDRLLFWFNSVV